MVQAADADRETVTALLLEEMLNRTVCNVSHKTCAYNVGCHAGHYIYQNEVEKQRFYSENPGRCKLVCKHNAAIGAHMIKIIAINTVVPHSWWTCLVLLYHRFVATVSKST